MNELIVILFVTVCLGDGTDASCEEFGIETYGGSDAMVRCVEDLKAEVQVSEIQGTVQTWRCVEVSESNIIGV